MSIAAQEKPTTVKRVLTRDMRLAALEHFAVVSFMPTKFKVNEDGLIWPTDETALPLTRSSEQLTFRGHALAQLDGNRGGEDELAWAKPVRASYEWISENVAGAETFKQSSDISRTNVGPWGRLFFHVMLRGLKTTEGEPVKNPYGPEYALEVYRQHIAAPEPVPLTAEAVARIESTHPEVLLLKRGLERRLAES